MWIKMANFVSVSVSSASVTTVAITITIVTMVIHVLGNPQPFYTQNGKRETGEKITYKIGQRQQKTGWLAKEGLWCEEVA
jgi:hypothetical protein